MDELRKNNIPSEADYEGRSLKGALRKANDLGAKFVLIIGDVELKKGVATLKNMAEGTQKEIPASEIIKELRC